MVLSEEKVVGVPSEEKVVGVWFRSGGCWGVTVKTVHTVNMTQWC